MDMKGVRKARRGLVIAVAGVKGVAKLSHRMGRVQGRREARRNG